MKARNGEKRNMMTRFWKSLRGFSRSQASQQIEEAGEKEASPQPVHMLDIEMAPNDPLVAYLIGVSGVVDVDRLNLDSPVLQQLKEQQVKLVMPLVSQGELIGLLNLGPRRSEQDYSTDDRRLLNTLATQAAPALRVAQLVQQQQIEARERERIEQELRVARVIQQTLLPKEIPQIDGWTIAAHWQPAREVSGDFYDFISFPDGRLGLVIADVTDKGVPAALVMATTRSLLRLTAESLVSPGQVLERANNLLCPDIPPNMYVTCLYALLDPASGKLQYANAGHPPPYQRNSRDVVELRACGMPLGLLPDMTYDEKETFLEPGDSVFYYSDGLIEAHNPAGAMFGFPQLREKLTSVSCSADMILCLRGELNAFTGPEWEQEDDVTFLTLERISQPEESVQGERLLAEFTIPSEPGNEKEAIQQVVEAVRSIRLPAASLEKLKTAVGEATMNAMEHGNHYQEDKPVTIKVNVSNARLRVAITDHGGGQQLPEPETPDLESKLLGLQSPRGWGLFLIKNMVDEMNIITDEVHHTVELSLNLNGEPS
jgi:serine phosphatase RsbU (regulator of sigma subunit)/anti-sigma regulatory factor (Ser/Thr protein kinase)